MERRTCGNMCISGGAGESLLLPLLLLLLVGAHPCLQRTYHCFVYQRVFLLTAEEAIIASECFVLKREKNHCVWSIFLLSIFFHFLFSRETSVQCNYGEFCCCCHTKDPKEKENEGEKRRNTLLLLQRRGCKRSFIQRQREEGK